MLSPHTTAILNRKNVSPISLSQIHQLSFGAIQMPCPGFSQMWFIMHLFTEGNYQITAAIEEAQTVITIKNASSSIQQEDIPHLFDRFYTTDQSRTKKTTGLGLAIAQRLVTRMGGQIVASLQNGIFAIQVVFPIVNS